VNEIRRKIRAAQFLTRATFGPTSTDIDDLSTRMKQVGHRAAIGEWIDAQWEIPATSHRATAIDMISDDSFDPLTPSIGHNRYKDHAWWHIAVNADDQLRQRVAWALSQICVINERGGGFGTQEIDVSGFPRYLGVANYYDMLVDNSSTNYRTVLQDVALHPCMGVFLSHIRNRKANPARGIFPDENFAREVMQLMSIGLNELRPNGQFRRRDGQTIDTYDNDDIKAFASVFTGLSYRVDNNRFYGAPNLNEPMQAFDQYHDMDAKEVLRGQTLPGGNDTITDVTAALDNIFEHPNVPPFISRLLIQRLVKSNPSKGYIRRVGRIFKDNGQGVRGDMKSVVKAILMDREANSLRFRRLRRPYRLQVTQRGIENSKLREPVLAYTAFMRAFEVTNSYPTGRLMMPNLRDLNQAPYEAPHVFNFYLPDYQPPGVVTGYIPSRRIPNGSLAAPEFQIMTSVAANRTANRYYYDVRDANSFYRVLNSSAGRLENTITRDFSTEETLAADPAALLAHLDLVLCHGSMSESAKKFIASAIEEETTNLTLRARSAILAVLTSPDFMVTE
jgi:uncharacterized protein (DUF1800 family)